ncbi:putative oxidoreductase [Xylariaceae sp. FL0255]|nr:putative oxidoreductase [Xylariaceae sp. FL0255]
MAPDKQNLEVNCKALIALLGAGKVYLHGSSGYNASVASYFSPQAAALHPACFVAPQTAHDVAAVVKSLASADHGGPQDFAVRGGGHTWFADANNSPGGVTIDLRGLRTITVSADSTSVSVGAGATWDVIYGKLDTLGRSVAGGRVAGVGIGGLTLGGGFEVVLADGNIIEASETENSELWWALRGGSNNFGVVTRIDYRTFEQGLLWYTMIFNPLSTVDKQIAIYADLMSPQKYDVNASYLTGWAYSAKQGLTSALVQIPQASQYMTSTVTFEPIEAMIKETYAAFNKSLPYVQNVTQISWALNLEPLPPQIYDAQGGSGANALGLTGQKGRSLVMCLISVSWSDATQNQQVYDATRALMDNISACAKNLGVFDPYIYLNYAAPWQDVISSYGVESVAKLRRVRDKYDPNFVFTKQVAGGFKIPDELSM